MDYATLIAPKTTSGSIAELVNYAPLSGAAPEIVDNAQDELFSRLRLREMRKSVSLPLAVGASSAPLPTDFLDPEVLLDPYGRKVKRVDDASLMALRSYDSTGALISSYPGAFGIFDGAFQFDCGALQAITVRGMYYGATRIGPAIGAVGQPGYIAPVLTNVLTDRYSHLFRAMLLKHAYAYYKDWQAAAGYDTAAERYIATIQQGDDLSYRGLDDAEMGGRP